MICLLLNCASKRMTTDKVLIFKTIRGRKMAALHSFFACLFLWVGRGIDFSAVVPTDKYTRASIGAGIGAGISARRSRTAHWAPLSNSSQEARHNAARALTEVRRALGVALTLSCRLLALVT